jgi:hypothetical protein
MITHDNGYWSTGITVTYNEGRWSASVKFFDNGFTDDNPDTGQISTEGTLHTGYFIADGEQVDGLTAAIDTVKRDAERLGIIWRQDGTMPTVYMKGDGEDPEWPAPDGWRELVDAHAERLGWMPCYRTLSAL